MITNKNNQKWSLVAKKLAGEATEDELKQLQNLVEEDAYMSALMIDLTDLWRSSSLPPNSHENKSAGFR